MITNEVTAAITDGTRSFITPPVDSFFSFGTPARKLKNLTLGPIATPKTYDPLTAASTV
jgi:hypothetical protein